MRGSFVARAALVATAAVAVILMLWRGGSRNASAIEKVLQADKALSATMSATAQHEGKAAVFRYVSGLEKIDLSACPSDFRVAFVQHIGAWAGLSTQLKMEPDGWWESALYGALRQLGGDWSGGANQMIDARQRQSSRITETYNEVREIAARYGARLAP